MTDARRRNYRANHTVSQSQPPPAPCRPTFLIRRASRRGAEDRQATGIFGRDHNEPNGRCAHRHRIDKGSPHSITERRVPELIPVLGSQLADDVSHKPGGRLPLLSARPAVTPVTPKRAATNFAV